MITIQALFHYLDQLLTPKEFSDYCPNGLQVEGKPEVKKICFGVSASLATIQEAAKRGADALVVHHGLFWNKDPHVILGTKKEKIAILLKHNISLLAYHLPLDAHQTVGNNWKAASDLGMKDLQSFQGIGVKGTLSSVSIEEFKHKLEIYYGHVAHLALGGKKQIQSAAIISGGAYRSIEQAADEGVDCFITGNFDEPAWDIAHERKIHFLALGHYATERIGILALMEHLHKHFQLPVEFLDLPNPF